MSEAGAAARATSDRTDKCPADSTRIVRIRLLYSGFWLVLTSSADK